jgi:glucose-6-phosphate 1-dehydrogenase
MSNSECIFVLFGATGDLARLKILPALQSLHEQNKLDIGFKLIAVGRKQMSTVEYINYLAHVDTHPFTGDLVGLNLEYVSLDFESQRGFDPLWDLLRFHDRGHTIFYMSVGPDVLENCIGHFHYAKNSEIWNTQNTSILVEKPFGEDGASAVDLNWELTDIFGDKVYRHDHYLNKDSVQAIVEIRKQDGEIAAILNHDNLAQIELVVSEKVDLGTRAGYFDGRGMLIDWVQSHVLQILATVAAKPDFANWQGAKAEFIASLSPMNDTILRGQYEGYMQMEGVTPNSQTETFLAVKLKSNLANWQNTEFSIVSGKAMAEKIIKLRFIFNQPHPKFGSELVWQLDPPAGHELFRPLSGDEFSESIEDVMAARTEKFVSMPEISAQWRVTDAIKTDLYNHPLETYAKGTSYQHFCTGKWCQIAE